MAGNSNLAVALTTSCREERRSFRECFSASDKHLGLSGPDVHVPGCHSASVAGGHKQFAGGPWLASLASVVGVLLNILGCFMHCFWVLLLCSLQQNHGFMTGMPC